MINVLDHGFARLVSYMQPAARGMDPSHDEVDNEGHWTGDLEIVRNARVSYDADWRTGEDDGKDAKLINRMARDRHSSPFEAMVFTFEIKAPIFVVRQWHRHRTWSYNEVSARYAELPEEFYVPAVEQITTQSTSNKQMRTDEQHPQGNQWRHKIGLACQDAFRVYGWMLADGVPRELARGVLPLNAYTRMFATVDLHNLFHFLTLRLHSHAQYEIRVYAEALLTLIEPIVPEAVKAFREHRLPQQPGSMTREQAIEIARRAASTNSIHHDYLHKAGCDPQNWEPHEWVIEAILKAGTR